MYQEPEKGKQSRKGAGVYLRIVTRLLIYIILCFTYMTEGVTTLKIVTSICLFLIFELSLLAKNRLIGWSLYGLSFLVILVGVHKMQSKVLVIMIMALAAFLEYLGLQVMDSLKKQHRLRDEAVEMEMALKEKNSQLLMEQDKEISFATNQERTRIAREIHDNVGHMLSRAILLLGAIQSVNKDETVDKQMELLDNTLNTAMDEMRKSVHDLHDDSINLEANIKEITSRLDKFKVEYEIDMSDRVNKDIKISFIGIVREAVSNIIKHSNGDTVDITLREHPGVYVLTVYDNGQVSEDVKKKISLDKVSGIGLDNIRSRAEAIGGYARFVTDSGFKVCVNVPKK